MTIRQGRSHRHWSCSLALESDVGTLARYIEFSTKNWKALACTVDDLVAPMKSIFTAHDEVRVIGNRRGEKVFEALASCRELRRCEDMGDYLRVRMDGRNLNYGKLFDEGDICEIAVEDYTSYNTMRLVFSEGQKLLLSLPEIRRDLEEARV